MLLEDLQVVLKVAEFRSITAAATNLDMRTATASAALKRVESALGVELFIRTTRHLRLTSAGERYIPQCEQALLMLDQAKQKMKDDLDIVDGELRITLSSDLGRNLVTPWLVDQTALAHQVILRYLRECRQKSDMDRYLCVCAGGHYQETPQYQYRSLHNSSGFELDPIRENLANSYAY